MTLELTDVIKNATSYMGDREMGKAYLLGYIWASLSDEQKLNVAKSMEGKI
jgi:hypothetical protein